MFARALTLIVITRTVPRLGRVKETVAAPVLIVQLAALANKFVTGNLSKRL